MRVSSALNPGTSTSGDVLRKTKCYWSFSMSVISPGRLFKKATYKAMQWPACLLLMALVERKPSASDKTATTFLFKNFTGLKHKRNLGMNVKNEQHIFIIGNWSDVRGIMKYSSPWWIVLSFLCHWRNSCYLWPQNP